MRSVVLDQATALKPAAIGKLLTLSLAICLIFAAAFLVRYATYKNVVILWGAVTCVLVYLIGRRFFRGFTGPGTGQPGLGQASLGNLTTDCLLVGTHTAGSASVNKPAKAQGYGSTYRGVPL